MEWFWQTPAFRSTIKPVGYFFEQLLFPSKCLKCGVYLSPARLEKETRQTKETYFCKTCIGDGVFTIDSPYCTRCGVKFSGNTGDNHVCETCIKTPLRLGKVRAPVEYKGVIKDAIPLFKYKSKLSLLSFLEPVLFDCYIKHYTSCGIDIVLPMPLHRHKLKERGFNQAWLLVRNFEKMVEKKTDMLPTWTMDLRSLERFKKTSPQTGFDIKERKKNLKNAFRVVCPDKIKDKHILLIDDVFTTGATCNEAAKELLKNGARKVDALVLARA